MKTINQNDVKEAAEALMTLNGNTTTLDVKNELRAQGFWARQHTEGNEMGVSEIMTELADSESWDVNQDNSNGNVFNRYSLQVVQAQAPSTMSTVVMDLSDPILAKIAELIELHTGIMPTTDDLVSNLIDQSLIDQLKDSIIAEFSLDLMDAAGLSIFMSEKLSDLGMHIANITGRQPAPIQKKTRVRINLTPISKESPTIDEIKLYPPTDWVLSTKATHLGEKKYVYTGLVTRDSVRSAYARLVRVPIQWTRARRVLNVDKKYNVKP